MLNLFKVQLKRFFNSSFSEPFLFICFIIIVLGAINMIIGVSSANRINNEINSKMFQREQILLSENKPIFEYGFSKHYKDAEMQKLNSEKILLFELAIQKFSFGWWGFFAIVLVFLINFLIVVFKSLKLLRKNITKLIYVSGVKVKTVTSNYRNMPAFQQYSLILFLIIAVALISIIFILI